MPERPKSGPTDPEMAAAEASALVTQAIDSLRDAVYALDEAAEFTSLPDDLAMALAAYTSVVNAVRTSLIELAQGELKATEGHSLPGSTEDVVRATSSLLEPTPQWTESMAKLERHLASRPRDDDPAET